MSNRLDSNEHAAAWRTLAERLSRLEEPVRSNNIAICLALAYRKGKLGALLEAAKTTESGMSPEEREAYRERRVLEFAYGNVAMSNPSITMDDVRKAAAELKAQAPLRTHFTDDGQVVTVWDRVED